MVLFDIDGTLLWGGPLWKESFLRAVSDFFPEIEIPTISFNGKTDIQITREMLAESGLTPQQVEDSMHHIIDRYIEYACVAAQSRAHEVQVLPGVAEILKELVDHPEVVLGLLTGNVKKGAHAKLSTVGLHDFFKVGVFGDDHWDRYKLPALAVARVEEHFGMRFTGKQIVIIGDTVHDVNCGKSIGVRSIAVGTGRNVVIEEVLAQNPDYYFHDLSNTSDVLAAILEDLNDELDASLDEASD
jgi:phosphoglycolate phosphatase